MLKLILPSLILLVALGISGWALWPSAPSATAIVPQPGEQWSWRCANAGPWDCPKRWTVTILEVKHGWVRYWLDEVAPDRRMELEIFTRVYAPPEKETR